ncbi:class I SAM-dependent methyltransferase [Yinghuangia seranimata]|uniref:class I SAM-dependent methyltransferase n=1 Tax=Yinghuangia seranimata TaxID=408067 RepID=UPI00248B8F1F|nr:class I SAM-dependent methyltransferase [Yinghuangia seranimata]MDI2128930.1 methyltransferase domain-containing protein [Yinghuangia seranimata]
MSWNAKQYDSNFSFVSQYGRGVVELLAPRADERILDLGCGTGDLAVEIAATGAVVHGVDGDPEMIRTAREKHGSAPGAPSFEVVDVYELSVAEPFDAVFSNAVLHWLTRPDDAIARVRDALLPGGRFVAEFGAGRNVATLIDGLRQAVAEVVPEAEVALPWYFPSTAEHATRLENAGFEVVYTHYFDRPTPLAEGDTAADWWRMFGPRTLAAFPVERHDALLARVDELLRDRLTDSSGRWSADYTRLRFVAVRR